MTLALLPELKKTNHRLSSVQLGMHWFPERAGGLDRVYFELFHHLPQAGVAFRGLVAGSDRAAQESGGFVRAFSPANTELVKRWWAVRGAINDEIVKAAPDVVVAHFALYAFPCLDRVKKFPFVMHFQGPWADEVAAERGKGLATKIQATIEKAVYKRADRLIVLSQSFATLLAERYQVDPSLIRVVPGGVDVDRFNILLNQQEARERLGWASDRPTVLVVRRLVSRMGLENLILAARTISTVMPDIQILIAGKGPLQEKLQAQIDSYGLGHAVSLIGFVSDEDLPLAYRAADLSVVPTTSLEGFGLITLESLAAGTPVLVTPVGGLPEAVNGLSPNMVLPGTEPKHLADGILAAIRGNLTLPDSRTCQEYVRLHHAWPVIAQKVRTVYEEAMT